MGRRQTGFTLIELLVVVAIIAILAAMMMPVYLEAKQASQRAGCQSNLAQIAKAFESYTSDYDGCYPYRPDMMDGATPAGESLWQGRFWRWALKKYVGYTPSYDAADPRGAKQSTHAWSSILRCPGDPTPGDVYDGTSYGYSAAFYHTPDQINAMKLPQLYTEPDQPMSVVKTGDVKYPTKKALVADWLSHTRDKSTWWTWGGARNYLLADGHVVYLDSKRIQPAVDGYPDINLTRNGVHGKDLY